MMSKKVKDLREGDRISQVFLCKAKKEATNKNGKPYLALTLMDNSGSVDAKVWDINQAIENFDAADFIVVEGQVGSYNNTLQVTANRIRKAYENEYVPGDYFPSTNKDIEKMYEELMKYGQQIQNEPMRQLVKSFFVDDAAFIKLFKMRSAAKSVHHSFIGGLLEHTLNVTRLCYFYCKVYPQLNRDLLIAAAMFHDIGKVREISEFPANDYTDDGQLLGHIVMGYEMVGERIKTIPNFPEKTASELKHCILAHHGELEYGSPKKPALMEAAALNFADNTDAKLEIFVEEVATSTSNDWLGKNFFLDSNVRKTTPLE